MKITISGQHIKIGASFEEYIQSSLDEAVKKYFDHATTASVKFTKESHLFVTHIVVNEGTGTGIIIKSDAKMDEIYASFDKACSRVEKQLRRYKRRLKSHKNVEKSSSLMEATKFVISDDGQEVSENDSENAPLIIAETQTNVEKLSVSDAVMRMNLANLPALMFINSKNGEVNVVYRRNDGNITWVDYNKAA